VRRQPDELEACRHIATSGSVEVRPSNDDTNFSARVTTTTASSRSAESSRRRNTRPT